MERSGPARGPVDFSNLALTPDELLVLNALRHAEFWDVTLRPERRIDAPVPATTLMAAISSRLSGHQPLPDIIYAMARKGLVERSYLSAGGDLIVELADGGDQATKAHAAKLFIRHAQKKYYDSRCSIPGRGFVYILRHEIHSRWSKIGYTTIKDGGAQRAENYAKSHGMTPWLVYREYPTPFPTVVEEAVHRRLAERRVRLYSWAREIFDILPHNAAPIVESEIFRAERTFRQEHEIEAGELAPQEGNDLLEVPRHLQINIRYNNRYEIFSMPDGREIIRRDINGRGGIANVNKMIDYLPPGRSISWRDPPCSSLDNQQALGDATHGGKPGMLARFRGWFRG